MVCDVGRVTMDWGGARLLEGEQTALLFREATRLLLFRDYHRGSLNRSVSYFRLHKHVYVYNQIIG